MITAPGITAFSTIVYENTSPEVRPVYNAGPVNKSQFDKLLALVFDHQRVQKLTFHSDYSNIFITIANMASVK
jgi:hypothetical protein